MELAKRIYLLIAALVASGAFAEEPTALPRPSELEPDIRFWTRIYTEVDTGSGLIHDARHLNVVYEVTHFASGSGNRVKRRRVKRVKQHYKKILLMLARGKRQHLSADEQRVLALWPEGVSNRTLRTAAHRLRFQLGQADKFRAGLIRSGAWEEHIHQTLLEMGLPVELVALPHVESSYNPVAYSRVGAAGLWQFTRSTGRRYMRIDGAVDERMDPLKSSVAAARLLKHNRTVTGSWPLAITAYNHGAAGMRRAVRKLGSHDITTIVRRYNSRTFGFASRNFYVAFLAAVDVHFNAEKYFGTLRRDPPIETEIVKVPAYLSVDSLQRSLGVDRATLRRNNPALRPAVWQGSKYVPRGYALRVPRDSARASAMTALARIPAAQQYREQKPERFHKVRRGNTLAGIAARYNVSVSELVAINGLRNRHHIRVGQVLRLPLAESGATVSSIAGPAAPAADVSLLADGLYRVRYGDTLSMIALRFGVDEEALMSANQLRNRDRIRAGQILRVAVASAEVTAAATTGSPPVVSTDANPKATVTEPQLSMMAVAEVESAEPASAEEAESFGPTLPLGVHPALSADPSDYSVRDDDTIEVQAAETLGHYAEWLGLRAARLRRINDMRYGEPVVIGERLALDFSRVSVEAFEQRRLAYHRELQETFFTQFQITGTHVHVVRRGESLWVLAQRRYSIPIWLLRQYNPDLDVSAVLPGTSVSVPLVEARREATPSANLVAPHTS